MRVYDELVELDYTATQRFFEQRGERLAEVGPLSAVLYQDHQPDLAQRRSAHEIELIAPHLRTDGHPRRILDLGVEPDAGPPLWSTWWTTTWDWIFVRTS